MKLKNTKVLDKNIELFPVNLTGVISRLEYKINAIFPKLCESKISELHKSQTHTFEWKLETHIRTCEFYIM